MVEAGELNPTEDDDVFDRAVRKVGVRIDPTV
jgi:hypothetical protein